MDVRRSLKCKKKIVKKDSMEFIVTYKNEKIGEFCFSCGIVTRTDMFSINLIDNGSEKGVKEWRSWLRAPPRRVVGKT